MSRVCAVGTVLPVRSIKAAKPAYMLANNRAEENAPLTIQAVMSALLGGDSW